MTKRSELELDTIYYVADADQYIVTPDGVGVYVYETLEEAEDNHGEEPNAEELDSLED